MLRFTAKWHAFIRSQQWSEYLLAHGGTLPWFKDVIWIMLNECKSLNVLCYCYPTGGLSLDSCSPCPHGHYCSIEGLASPSGLCAAGFYCPFDFSSTTPYAFLCPKVSLVLLASLLSIWTTVEPQRFEPHNVRTDWSKEWSISNPGHVFNIFYCGWCDFWHCSVLNDHHSRRVCIFEVL